MCLTCAVTHISIHIFSVGPSDFGITRPGCPGCPACPACPSCAGCAARLRPPKTLRLSIKRPLRRPLTIANDALAAARARFDQLRLPKTQRLSIKRRLRAPLDPRAYGPKGPLAQGPLDPRPMDPRALGPKGPLTSKTSAR